MKSLTRGHLKAGLDSVRSAKMRNVWTMLGIIIGITSVITVVSIGEGIKQQVTGQIHHLGNNLITVRPAAFNTSSNGSASDLGVLSGSAISGSLSAQDINTVADVRGVTASAPLTAVPGAVRGDNGLYSSGLIIGTTSDLPSLLNQSMAFGSFLNSSDDNTNVAVLGSNASAQLFNEDVPLGRSFAVHGQQFIVIGVFNEFAQTPLGQQVDFNKAIFIPNDVAESLTNNTAPTYEILARATTSKQTASVAGAINHSLQQAHGGPGSFSVLQQNQNLAASNDILELLTRLIAGVAAISLLVGGIGIMNVMLVSVAERMHEIGIRKAVGATNRQILSQFVIESSVLSLSGGVIGVILSLLIDVGLRLGTSLQPAISWQIVTLATGVSLLVGVIFGSVPAIKAARKDPIEALRSE